MAQMPNWFDREFEGPLEKATAQEAMAEIAKCPQVVRAVEEALAQYDENKKKPRWAGPTRSQVVRKAIAEVLQAED